jgi:hypothetical protein
VIRRLPGIGEQAKEAIMATRQYADIGVALFVAVVTTVVTPNRAGAQFFVAEQGSTRSMSTTSATLTGISGVPGFISATTQRPFVVGLIPVVGDYGGAIAPVYGPAPLFPTYNPGPSVVQQRIAQMRQEGIALTPSRPGSRSMSPTTSAVDRKPRSFQSRLAAARESSAGHAVESIANIRRRQGQQSAGHRRETADVSSKMREGK